MWGERICGNYVLSVQLFYKPKTALKTKVFKKEMSIKEMLRSKSLRTPDYRKADLNLVREGGRRASEQSVI